MTITTQNPSGFPTVLHFEGAELRIIDVDGQPWITATDLSRALGYSRRDHVSRIYRDNQREFTDSMTQVISLQPSKINENTDTVFSSNLPTRARIFSPRGCYALGFFARTSKAAAFRSWVLDVLEGIAPAPHQRTAPSTDTSHSLAALVADSISGPALSEIPAILAACGQRLSGAMCLPHWQSAPAPSEMAEFVASTRSLNRQQMDAVAVAAVRRLMHERGSHGVQHMLREVNPDYLLVNEPELVLSLYRARGLPQGVRDE